MTTENVLIQMDLGSGVPGPPGPSGSGVLPSGGASLQALTKKSSTTGDADWFTLNGLVMSVGSDVSTSDPLDQQWASGTFTAERSTVTLDIDGAIWANGGGLCGVELIYSQSVLSGNLWNGTVNGVVSGATRTRVFGSVLGQGVPGGKYPSLVPSSTGTLGYGIIRNQVTLTGLTAGQPVYVQMIPVVVNQGTPLLPVAAGASTFVVSPSGRRGYFFAGASFVPLELGRDVSNWLDSAYPTVSTGSATPVRAFVTSDGKKLWTSTSAGGCQVYDTDTFALTSSPTVSGQSSYGMCQDPTGTITVDIANFGGAYCTSGSATISTFAAAFKPAAVGKTLSGGLAAAFPANTKVASYNSPTSITMSANATTTVSFANVGTYTPCVLDGIAYVADQGSHNKVQLFDVVSGAAGSAYTLTSPYVPYTLAASPDGTKLAVYCKNSTLNYRLLILNAQTGSISADIDVGTNSGNLPDPVWEPDSVHGWVACFGSSQLRRFNATSGTIETAHDTAFNQPLSLAITPSGNTLFVGGSNTSASSWAYFMLNPLPSGALVQYDGNHTYGAVNAIALGPDCFIYSATSSGYLGTVRGGTIGCFAGSQPSLYHLEVRVAGGH